jgi:uncharacterized small protein (DUF1192 family)
MVRHSEGGWKVGTKDDLISLERVSETDERIFEALLEPDEAREIAELLNKHADKVDPPDA